MIKPLFNKVLIEIDKAENVTSSGIILASEEEKLEKATVISIGEDVLRVAPQDKILFKAYSADTIKLDGNELSFVKEEDILALL